MENREAVKERGTRDRKKDKRRRREYGELLVYAGCLGKLRPFSPKKQKHERTIKTINR